MRIGKFCLIQKKRKIKSIVEDEILFQLNSESMKMKSFFVKLKFEPIGANLFHSVRFLF